MIEPSYLTTLRTCLAQCEEGIPLISDAHDKQILEDHANLLRADIRRMEEWAKKQEPKGQRVTNEMERTGQV